MKNTSQSSIVTASSGVMQCNSVLSSVFVTRFSEFLDVSEITLRAYRSGIKQFIVFCTANRISQPNRETVIMFKKELTASGRKPSTVALYMAAIRRFFSWCASEGLYPDIAAGVKSPKQDKGHKKDALSGVQIRACLKGLAGQSEEILRNRAMFLLMACTGLRTIEITRADVADIQQVQGVPVLFVHGKGRSTKSEFVKLSEPVMQALREYLSVRGQVKADAPLFSSCSRRNRGQRLTTRTVSSVVKKALQAAGYSSPRLTAHSLRHSAATLALEAGMPLQEVSEFLRHSSIAITMVYVHSINRLNSGCESAVSRAIFAA